MSRFLVLIFLFPFTLMAQDFVKVNGLDVDIKKRVGKGEADFFRVDSRSFLRSRDKFDLTFDKTSAHFKFPSQELEVTNLPSFLTKIKDLVLKDFDLTYKYKENGVFSFAEASFGPKVDLSLIALKCYNMREFNFEMVLESCLDNMKAEGKSVAFKLKESQNFITDINLVVKDGKFELTAGWQKGIFKGRFYASGEVDYLANEQTIRLKVDKAKLGVVGVKNLLFSILKNNESKNFKVDKPYIYVTLK